MSAQRSGGCTVEVGPQARAACARRSRKAAILIEASRHAGGRFGTLPADRQDPSEAHLESLRKELAIAAARLIADSGLDYGAAKRKAVRELLGQDNAPRGMLPDNREVDDCLREHLELFDGPAHAARVRRLRETALVLMELLAPFDPYVTGAAWKGIATEHAPVHLQLFCDNAKEASIFLLNAGIRYEPIEVPHFRGNATVEGAAFEHGGVPVVLSLYDSRDLRGALRAGEHGAERGTRTQLAARLAADVPA